MATDALPAVQRAFGAIAPFIVTAVDKDDEALFLLLQQRTVFIFGNARCRRVRVCWLSVIHFAESVHGVFGGPQHSCHDFRGRA